MGFCSLFHLFISLQIESFLLICHHVQTFCSISDISFSRISIYFFFMVLIFSEIIIFIVNMFSFISLSSYAVGVVKSLSADSNVWVISGCGHSLHFFF